MSNFFSNVVEDKSSENPGRNRERGLPCGAGDAQLEQYRVSLGLWWSI
jgi:hypothetical protein